ncbi:MAG: M1 family peptidase [Bacteroidia bacterium]|nr:MAG: M1 family peptidase [Bacteroidia bacterium]
MKNYFLAALFLTSQAVVSAQSNYNAKEAFAPDFYTSNGNAYRSASGMPGPSYWQNRADYDIKATLLPDTHRVNGVVNLTYTNNSPDNLDFLWLQLDQNIYEKDSRATATTTMAGGRWANAMFTNGDEIKAVSIIANGKKYTPKFMINDTRMQIMLNEELKSKGGVVTVQIDFGFNIPTQGTDRMGRLNTKNGWVYQLAQWFPRVCVYDDIQGWNVLPYLGQGEFYLEYGNVNYTITAPSELVVVGSGELLNAKECFSPAQYAKYEQAKNSDKTVTIRSAEDANKGGALAKTGGTTTWKFKMNNTRDIAWAASKAFVLDGAKINLPSGKKSLAMSAYPVESITTDGWQRSTEMVKGSIEGYSKRWYEYPYPAAINVAGTVGGMEYPGIVFCSYRSAGAGLWGVTDHEFGHIWFPMIVGSNERKYAWMDEGFNTFINDISTKDFNKGEFAESNPITNASTVKMAFNDKVDVLYTTPDATQQFSLGFTAYYKPAMMLHNLRDNVLGEERFDRAFKEYIKRWAYKHPTPNDFFRTMENVSGEDLAWFWRGWVFNNWKIDVAVSGVKYIDDDSTKGSRISLLNKEKMPMPVVMEITEANGKKHIFNLPVEIWQRSATYNFTAPTTSEVTKVVLDPKGTLSDIDRTNNTWEKK